MYPNPGRDHLNFQFSEEGNKNIKLLSIEGKILQEIDSETSRVMVDVSGLSPGVYIVQISENGVIENKKYVKQ